MKLKSVAAIATKVYVFSLLDAQTDPLEQMWNLVSRGEVYVVVIP